MVNKSPQTYIFYANVVNKRKSNVFIVFSGKASKLVTQIKIFNSQWHFLANLYFFAKLSFFFIPKSTLCRCRWQIDGSSSIVFKYSVDSIYFSGILTNFEHDICLQIKDNPLTRWAMLLDKIKIMKLQHVTWFLHFNSEMCFYCSKGRWVSFY